MPSRRRAGSNAFPPAPTVALVLVGRMAAADTTDTAAIMAMLAKVVETQSQHTRSNQEHQQRLIELTHGQIELSKQTQELNANQIQIQATVDSLATSMQHLDTKTQEMEAQFEALKQHMKKTADAATGASDAAMTANESTAMDKKRKVAAASAADAAGAAVPSARHGGDCPSSSWAQAAGRQPASGTPFAAPSRAGSSGDVKAPHGQAARDEDIRARVVLKRLPPVMKDRLPSRLAELFACMGDDLLRVQGPQSGTSFTLVLRTADRATALLRRHKESAFTGTFESGGSAVQLNLQPDREVWLRKLLTLQWPVLHFLRSLPTIENASMTKYRVADRRFVRIYVKEAGRDILREVGNAEYREVTEDGPEPDEWVSFTPGEGTGEVAAGVRKAMGLADDA